MRFANGYTMAMAYNIDPLGTLYGSLAATWTTMLLLGVAFLIANRNQPCVHLRNIPLALSAVAMLHVYWILCLLAYMLQGYFPCGVEFWIMSVYLPLGMALFHAANTQLLQTVMLQKQHLRPLSPISEKVNGNKKAYGWQRAARILHSKNKVKRTMGCVSCFMVLQVMITLLIYFVSHKFHPSFGLTAPGFETQLNADEVCEVQLEQLGAASCDAAKRMACRRGWEWIPSIAWQFFWAWLYAPYLLYKLRGVRDVHRWRVQTVVCCIAGLPATPLWLAALYVPRMKDINRYYIPPMWFAPSILLIEACVIFVPCWTILMNRRLERSTDIIIKEWQLKRRKSTISLGDGSTLVDASSHMGSTLSTPSMHRGQMYTMEALETTLRQNPQPLLQFASLRDFSGENVSFLVHVMKWKLAWLPSSPTRNGNTKKHSQRISQGKSLRQHQFEQALEIYMSFVSLKYSDYAVNLSHAHYKHLEDIFEGAASIVRGPLQPHADTVTPFNDFWNANRSVTSMKKEQDINKSATSTSPAAVKIGHNLYGDSLTSSPGVQEHGSQIYDTIGPEQQSSSCFAVPDTFSPEVFDGAEESIKYMVLTNTWCKFVKDGESNASKKNLVHQVRDVLV